MLSWYRVKIAVTGYKTEWSGEVETAGGATFEIEEGADEYIAPASRCDRPA